LDFCSRYDEALASTEPAAVFLRNKRGEWRFDAEWSRDSWLRAEGPHTHRVGYRLWRDNNTGYVVLLMVTSETLLLAHPKGQVRSYPSLEAAQQARAEWGTPPIAESPWAP
jgi:hypothetical protein